MKSSKRVVKAGLAGALVLALGITTLFANAGNSYAAGEAKLNKTSRSILTRQSFDFDVTGAPSDASVTWKSSNEKVATVDKDGVVTGVTKGTATITCEITSGGKTQKLTAKVSICKPAVKIEINNKVSELKYGTKVDLNRTLTPKTSNDVTTWKSSDIKIATVDSNGVVTALKDGTVTITATTMSGRSDSVEITVYGAPAPTKAPEPTATPVPTAKPDAPKPTTKPSKPSASNVIYSESFESSKGDWAARGNTTLSVKKSAASPDGLQYLQVSGRTANWHGAALGVNSLLELGGTYKLTAQVRQTAGDGEVIKATFQKNGDQYSQVATVTTNKNEWVELSGEFTVDTDTKDLLLYFEADTMIDILIDKVVITEISGGSKLIFTAPTSADGAIVYKLADLTDKGYGYTKTVAVDGGVQVKYSEVYQEIQYVLPQAVDLSKYKTLVISASTATATDADAIAFKIAASDAATDQYGNPESLTVQYGFMSATKADCTIDLSSFAGKKVSQISIMSNNGAASATLYTFTFK